jgi:Na+/H+-translocating membrane pyrophosphatase
MSDPSSDNTFNVSSNDQERLAAMRVIADAMEEGMRQGLHRDALTVACFTVVLQMLVDVYGREAVNHLVGDMGPRVMAGDFG